jgi:Cu(I)/Ag(I) efflux system membrane fusion protein/cobalt-zinc-cadmium efflux system membrane fusion protein
MELSFQKGRLYEGKVSYIYPTLDEQTRTLTVRLEFENPGLQLKPGMFSTIRIDTRKKSGVLVVPSEAIIRSGERNVVFVAHRLGIYEPREVVTGLTGDEHRTEVLEGLEEGETVVRSGQFLLDSESQLQEAMQKMVSGGLHAHQHDEGAPPKQEGAADDGGDADEVVWTCPMHPQIAEEEPGQCPICGMDLVRKKVK